MEPAGCKLPKSTTPKVYPLPPDTTTASVIFPDPGATVIDTLPPVPSPNISTTPLL